MSDRKPLKKGDIIDVVPLHETGPQQVRHFVIDDVISDAGSTSICYKARSQKGAHGVLKEFYPKKNALPQRDRQSRQLLCSDVAEAEMHSFHREMAAYLKAYTSLLDIKHHSSASAENLAACIPQYEFFRGCSKEGAPVGTAYVWLPIPAYRTFDQVCSEIHNDPKAKPQHNLVLLLKSLCELAASVLELHAANLIHRDVKPHNFGFLTRGSRPLEQSLTFFDADTICRPRDWREQQLPNVESPGFSNPAVLESGHQPQIEDDIYSIGATVFFALIDGKTPEMDVTDPEGCKAYIDAMVNGSQLLDASRRFLPPKFKYRLSEFLLKCFQLHTDSYGSCVQVQEALEKLRDSVMPVKPPADGKWIWREAERHLDKKQDATARLALQYHLYRHPLYEYSDEKKVNVLILGFGYYGQSFMDSCLQAGQLLNQTLHVTVFSDDEADKTVYLADRPALPEFFNVDGSLEPEDPKKPSYGSITFRRHTLNFRGQDGRAQIDGCLRELKSNPPHYIFIALGDDALNLAAARQCRGVFPGGDRIIHFACEDEKILTGNETFSPVLVNRTIRKSKDYRELERMAFNSHLVWEKGMDISFTAVHDQFLDPYNHTSCMDAVLSLKAKLHGFGIELGEMSPVKAAADFAAKCKDDPQTRQQTIWLEHRRWVTQKICEGWTAITDLRECIHSSHKDTKRKRHTCLVRSAPNTDLSALFCYEDSQPRPDQWDQYGPVDRLDPLDRMSIALHRTYLAHAQENQEQRWAEICGVFALIDQKLGENATAHRAWEEYQACIQDVWFGYSRRVYQLDALRQAFLSCIPDSSAENTFILKQLESLDAAFTPTVNSMKYTNFKNEDVKMVDQIPFILTYDEHDGLIVPYWTGNNSQVFQNVAAALVINPEKLVYLCYVENRTELKEICDSFSFLSHFIQRKNLRAQISFKVAFPKTMVKTNGTPDRLCAEITRQLTDAANGREITVDAACTENGDTSDFFRRVVSHASCRHYALEINDSKLSSMMQGAHIYRNRRTYRFSAKRMTFTEPTEYRVFTYITKKPQLSASDILSIRKSAAESFDYPEFRKTYADIWNKSRENRGFAWKKLCALLRDHLKQQSLIVSFSLQSITAPQEYTYYIPKECYPAMSNILTAMKKAGMIGPQSRLELNTTQSYRVIIHDRTNSLPKFNILFSDPARLMTERDIQIVVDNFNLKLYHNTLIVKNLALVANNPSQIAQMADLLRYLVSQRYLQCYASVDGKHSFSFATHGVKNLLTNEGKALEIYVYHKLKTSGFDDVVTSYEILWEDTDVRSEFDCIATRGFNSLFIECKARAELNQDFYFKLNSLVEHFGVNARAILIADTQENRYQADTNAMQRVRGQFMNVITIWKYEEIRDIDKTLLKILRGNYIPIER